MYLSQYLQYVDRKAVIGEEPVWQSVVVILLYFVIICKM